ncbi:MAG: FKBP-type peptidyl-prolyl cis-trans isomerase [Flavobacteriales bacterium]
MIKQIIPFALAIAFFSCAGQQEKNEEGTNAFKPLTDTIPLVNVTDKVSYVLGANSGIGLKREGFGDVDINEFLKGVTAAVKNESPKITKEQANNLVNEYLKNKAGFTKKAELSYAYGLTMGMGYAQYGDMSALDLDKYKKGMQHGLFEDDLQLDYRSANNLLTEYKTEKGKEAGALFLEKNKTQPGVITLPSGLQYKVIEMGRGPKPKATDNVKVNYRGTLIDGKEFDSSYKRKEPISFNLQGVIRGWTEGLQLMPVGSKFQFYIPYDLAYGEQSQNMIPAYSTLIFDVELLDINK